MATKLAKRKGRVKTKALSGAKRGRKAVVTAKRGRPAKAKPRRAKAAKPRKAKAAKAVAKRGAPPEHEAMLGLISGFWCSQIIYTAVTLGVPDALGKDALTAEALAERAEAHPGHLRRLLRALVSLQILAEDRQGRFRLTKLGRTLRGDDKASLRNLVLMLVDDWNWDAWKALPYGVKTGEPIFEHVKGMPAFDYLRQYPDKERVFAASMASISATQNDAIARAYPFDGLTRLVDVGGAHGHLLAAVLGKAKKLKGVLYDQPQVVEAAGESGFLSAPRIAKRVEIVGGSFFDSVPEGADGYMMKYIIHDWDDEKCVRILQNCRDAMAPKGRVLVIDKVLKGGNAPDFGPLMDINMMVIPNGQERTKEEFAALFERAGLKLKRIHPTETQLSIIEAVQA